MNMEELYKVQDIVFKEMKTVTDNGKFRSREEIDNIYKLMDILKDIKCLEDEGYSEYDMGFDGRSYRYDNDGSYRGRGRNAKRDSMGRYASENRYSGRRYSRDDGREDYKAQLEELMDNAPDEQTRKNIQRMINDMG